MPKESEKATITAYTGTPLVRVVDGLNSRNISPANLVGETGAAAALDDRYGPHNAPNYATIQAAIDAANAVYLTSGRQQVVNMLGSVWPVTAPVVMKAGVRLQGPGAIVRSSPIDANAFAVLTADAIDGWDIVGVNLEAARADLWENGAGIKSAVFGQWNSCLAVRNCNAWSVTDCRIESFSQGIHYEGCQNFRVINNTLLANIPGAQAAMLDGTYGFTWFYNGTACIGPLWSAAGPPIPSANFVISDNVIDADGIDVGISALSQQWSENPSVVSNNVIRGARAGIQIYRGSYPSPDTQTSYAGQVLVDGNRISICWEHGIYVRTVTGNQITNNYLNRVGLVGTNGTGASAGGIVVRADPFGEFPLATTPTDEAGNLVANNYILNPGKNGAVFDGAIQARIEGTRVVGNTVVVEAGMMPGGVNGPAVKVSESLRTFEVTDNRIVGGFSRGVFVENPNNVWCGRGHKLIARNRIENSGMGISVTGWAEEFVIASNLIRGGSTGIDVRFAPFAQITDNVIEATSGDGVLIQGGCLASDVPYIRSGGSITNTIRRGGSVTLRNNAYHRIGGIEVNTSETNGDDATAFGRCAVWEGDTIDGVPLFAVATNAGIEYTRTAVRTVVTTRTWVVGDIQRHPTPATFNFLGFICVTSGTYGAATTTTGSTTSGSNIVTAVASLNGLGPSVFITIAGVSGVYRIVDIDIAASTLTLASNAGAAVTGAVIAPATPTFENYAPVSP